MMRTSLQNRFAAFGLTTARMSSVFVFGILVSMTAAQAQQDKEIVAQAGSKNITLKEFNEKYDEVRAQTINPPPKDLFLEDLVRYEIGVQEAKKENMENDPIVQERFRQEMYKGLIEKKIGKAVSEIKVDENEMKAFYQKNPEIRTSHILIEFKPDATEAQKEDAKKRAQEIFAEVRKSKRPFEELVNLYTDDVLTKKNGGDLGWQGSATLVPPYYEAALKLKVGEVSSSLIETQFGFHIIKLTAKRSFNEANKRNIRASVFDEKRKDIFDAYFAKVKKGYTIKINKALLK